MRQDVEVHSIFSFLSTDGRNQGLPSSFFVTKRVQFPLFWSAPGLDLPPGQRESADQKVGRLTLSQKVAECQKGLFVIGKSKDTDWNIIRAEYITGTISQKKLAEKYGVSFNTLIKRANKEKWNNQRGETYKSVTRAVQKKAANCAADNAALAAGIKRKLLERLDRILEEFPEDNATEVQKFGRTERKVYKLKDLTAMYKDLTADMAQTETAGSELLQSLLELERKVDHG